MTENLTLKQRIQLFKISKKPRKQIRLRFDTLTFDWDVPKTGSNIEAPFRNFKVNKKEFKWKYDSLHTNVRSKTQIQSQKTFKMQILRLKNELSRQKLYKQTLLNRKYTSNMLKTILQERRQFMQIKEDFASLK